jgi:ACS family tartrate transporter-like MFS transporter
MVTVGASSDRSGERVLHSAACAGMLALSAFAAAMLTDPVARIAALIVMQMSVTAFLAPFWTLPTIILSGSSAAVGIALVNAIGNVGGFIGPTLIGFLKTATGNDSGAFVTLGAMALVASLICVSMRRIPSLTRGRPVPIPLQPVASL